MRILSQDGITDVPYEQCGIFMFFDALLSGEYEIDARLTENRNYKMAEYSTSEKARKAMEMLGEAYCGNLHIYIDKFVLMAKNYASRPELLKLLNEAVEHVKYFRFPSDDEVEV